MSVWLFGSIQTNVRYTVGFGFGIGLVYQSTSKEMKEIVLEIARIVPEFDRGLGTGIGISFQNLSEQIQHEALEIMDSNLEFCIGIGMGIGYTSPYLSREPAATSSSNGQNVTRSFRTD